MSEKNDFFQIKNIQEIAVSAIDSVLSLNTKKMFDVKPINTQLNSNETYTNAFGYEALFDQKEYVETWSVWFKANWTLSILVSLCYIITIFSIKYYMQNRPRFELRSFLIVWNIFLAVFSIAGTIRVWPEFTHTITKHGIVHSVCDNSYAYGITGFWSLMFCLSKLPELVDTIFIVFRKQELIFLHWYHHTTVLIYCFYSYKDFTASGRWFMSMNFFVHSMMYSYYALKAMRFKVPRFVSQLITTGQLLQMVAGCYVNYVAYQAKTNQIECGISDENIFYSSLMYGSYFVLFANFFINTYIIKKPKTIIKPSPNSNDDNAQTNLIKPQRDENNNHILNVPKLRSKAKKMN